LLGAVLVWGLSGWSNKPREVVTSAPFSGVSVERRGFAGTGASMLDNGGSVEGGVRSGIDPATSNVDAGVEPGSAVLLTKSQEALLDSLLRTQELVERLSTDGSDSMALNSAELAFLQRCVAIVLSSAARSTTIDQAHTLGSVQAGDLSFSQGGEYFLFPRDEFRAYAEAHDRVFVEPAAPRTPDFYEQYQLLHDRALSIIGMQKASK